MNKFFLIRFEFMLFFPYKTKSIDYAIFPGRGKFFALPGKAEADNNRIQILEKIWNIQ